MWFGVKKNDMKKIFLLAIPVVTIILIGPRLYGCSNPVQGDFHYTSEVYKEVDNQKLLIHIFEPEEKAKPAKSAIVFFHGGGWAFGDPSEFFSTCERYAKMGIVTFSVQYRLCIKDGVTPHPSITPVECVKDVRSAMRWVRSQSTRFNIDPEKIVVAGQSVGGQLALSTLMIPDVNEATDDLSISTLPNAVMSFSGTVNIVEAWGDYLLGDRREEIWSISPAHNIDKNMKLPPIIHFHGQDDNVVALWTVKFFKRDLGAEGEAFDLREYEGRKHYLGAGNEEYSNYYDEDILKEADEFLRKNKFLN